MTSISATEFASLLQGVLPKSTKRIGVAFSGGPDSLSLLFLLNRHIYQYQPGLSLISITIDHLLQATSTQTTRHCQALSETLGVENVSVKIPWGLAPFPPLPEKGTPFEQVAREARYHLLFDVMRKRNLDTLAMGHHADDQVETLLMRMLRQESSMSGSETTQFKLGWAGMKKLRRWGMGFGRGEGSLGWAGAEGMAKWIARPLLDIPKDRLVATCKEHGLQFVNDPTNFQPEITIRNAIRSTLVQQGNEAHSDKIRSGTDVAVRMAASALGCDSLQSSPNLLRSWVKHLGSEAQALDEKVTAYLESHAMIPKPSTLLLFSQELLENNPGISTAVKHSLLLRVLRFISPRPWGQPSAEAGRHVTQLSALAERIFQSDKIPILLHKPFTHGADVLWTPVYLRSDGSIKLVSPSTTIKVNDRFGWLASRSPIRNFGASSDRPRTISVDVEKQINQRCPIDVLWDNRFVVTIRPWLFPDNVLDVLTKESSSCRIAVVGQGRWVLPRVEVKQGDETLRVFDLSSKVNECVDYRFVRVLSSI
ncbi:hypothetical protein FRC02_001614 [Tulasnella sp. 418]|nr:hypothetical protein FRC02_001614 [Tulasnella sp. 418]